MMERKRMLEEEMGESELNEMIDKFSEGRSDASSEQSYDDE